MHRKTSMCDCGQKETLTYAQLSHTAIKAHCLLTYGFPFLLIPPPLPTYPPLWFLSKPCYERNHTFLRWKKTPFVVCVSPKIHVHLLFLIHASLRGGCASASGTNSIRITYQSPSLFLTPCPHSHMHILTFPHPPSPLFLCRVSFLTLFLLVSRTATTPYASPCLCTQVTEILS